MSESSTETVAWLTCDVTDADPVQFWTALVVALRTFDPQIGTDALDLLEADGHLGYEAIASLVNDLFDIEGDRVLVIDDLHLVARSALEPLGDLLERISPSLRVVLSARSDPRLPLHRWRGGGRLGELRASDLQMQAAEVGELVRMVGVEVVPDDAALLADRTEGWAAGVQLAALSMRHESEPADFIHAFAGTDRNVADYLIGEVLRRQSEETVSFLLDTSVLDELSAPVCDRVAERSDSAAMLVRLERENLFVVPLDNQQARYRYHQLFAELLRRMLAARHPGRALERHQIASDWYTDHDDARRRAVRHAVLAEDPALLAGLLRGRTFTAYYSGTSEMVREWINELSTARAQMPAELLLEYAFTLLMVGAIQDARACLARVDAKLPADAPALTRARLAMAHAFLLGLRGEIESSIEMAEQARALVEPGVDGSLDGTLQQLSLRYCVYMDAPAAARALYEAARAQSTDPGQLDQLVLTGAFSQAELEAGELASARMHAETAQADAARLGGAQHTGATEAIRTLGSLAYEDDQLDLAEQQLERCIEIIGASRPTYLLLTYVELAKVWNARGDREAAFAALDQARRALPSDVTSRLADRVDAYRARLFAEHGDAAGARKLAGQLQAGRRRLVADVRSCLAEQDVDGAREVLEHLIPSNNTPRSELEYALLDARVSLQDDGADSSAKVERVLELGRAAGFARTLADEGPELAAALAEALRHQRADAYSDRVAPVLERAVAAAPAHNVSLFAGVTLSERELTVLQYLATRLTTREIAAELYVSMNTFRTHSKSIYRKLGVDSRAAAVETARAQGIL